MRICPPPSPNYKHDLPTTCEGPLLGRQINSPIDLQESIGTMVVTLEVGARAETLRCTVVHTFLRSLNCCAGQNSTLRHGRVHIWGYINDNIIHCELYAARLCRPIHYIRSWGIILVKKARICGGFEADKYCLITNQYYED